MLAYLSYFNKVACTYFADMIPSPVATKYEPCCLCYDLKKEEYICSHSHSVWPSLILVVNIDPCQQWVHERKRWYPKAYHEPNLKPLRNFLCLKVVISLLECEFYSSQLRCPAWRRVRVVKCIHEEENPQDTMVQHVAKSWSIVWLVSSWHSIFRSVAVVHCRCHVYLIFIIIEIHKLIKS